MAYKIIGESIKSATSIKLGELFDNPVRYKENITNPKYPHFFIQLVDMQITPAGTRSQNRVKLDYTFNIRYRVAEDIETVENLYEKLDDVGFKLCTQLLELDLELPTKTRDRYYEKVDGVLQFFFSITVYAIPEVTKDKEFKEYKLNKEVI